MAEAPREPEDELRELYARVQPPPLADGIDEADPETRRVVNFMQAAWRGVEPPRATLPPGLARRASPAGTKRSPRRVLLAAAAVLLAVGGVAFLSKLASRMPTVLSPVDEVAPAPSGEVAPAPGDDVAPAPDNQVAPAPGPSAAVEILAIGPDQVELRAGPVRLVLLDPPASRSSDASPGT